jgi:hypothetical protein
VIRELARRLLGRQADQAEPDVRWIAFFRGVALGALVGAAIAGSSIWKRRRRS